MNNSKKGFTLFEILVVIVILSFLTVVARPFFNVKKQEEITYSENCLNYIFGEIDKFQTDITYGKTVLSGYNGSPTIGSRIYFWGTITTWGGIRSLMQFRILNSNNTWRDTNVYQFSHLDYGTFWSRVVPCRNPSYAIAFTQSTLWNGNLAVYKDNNSIFINSWNMIQSPSVLTGEIIVNTCWVIALWNGSWTLTTVWRCIQAGKIYADKRFNKIQTYKCKRINTSNWTCQSRPTTY